MVTELAKCQRQSNISRFCDSIVCCGIDSNFSCHSCHQHQQLHLQFSLSQGGDKLTLNLGSIAQPAAEPPTTANLIEVKRTDILERIGKIKQDFFCPG